MQHKKRLTLMMPDLFGCLKNEIRSNDLVYLASALSKAKLHKHPLYLSELVLLAKHSGMDNFNAQARAALYLHGIDLSPNSWVCYVTPVLMQPNRDHLSIVQSSGFGFDQKDVEALCSEFNDYFKDDGFQFLFLNPDTWFCYSDNALSVSTESPHNIVGENIMAYLPSRESDVQWRKLFNETQMLLHHSATNQARILNDTVEINSLWFWGGGALPAPYESPFSEIFANNAEVKGFAKLGGVDNQELPTHLMNEGADQLVYVDVTAEPDPYSLIEHYVESIIQSLKNKTLHEVTIIPDFQQAFTLNGGDLKKFWKSSQSIDSFLK